MACGGGSDIIPPFTVDEVVAAGDLNKDGFTDIVLKTTYIDGPPPHPGKVYIYLQDNLDPGNFLPSISFSVGADPWGIKVADLNGDDLPDIVTANVNSDNISILLQDATQSINFLEAKNLSCGQNPYAVSIGHLNDDNKIDIAVANYNKENSVSIFFQDPNSTGDFLPAFNFSTGHDAQSIAIGDLNQDGLMDIAVDGSDSVYIILQNELIPGEFMPPISIDAGERAAWVEIGDLNNDGFNDLVVANAGSSSSGANASVSVLIQNPDEPGNFWGPTNYPTADGARDVVIEDMDGDNKTDLVVGTVSFQSQRPGAVSVLLQSPSSPGTFLQSVNYYAGFTPNFVDVADLDNDGRVDIAVNEGPSILFQDPNSAGLFLPVTIIGEFWNP
jgi:hypothetical protein